MKNKIEYLVRLIVLKDRMQNWASVISFFMMFYLFATQILSGSSLKILSAFIILPIWVWISIPIILLLILGVIDMIYLYPRVQGYYMRNNCEWQDFRENQRKT